MPKGSVDSMIKYSSYGCANNQQRPSEETNLFNTLEEEYRELQELRERVRKAEAAAAKHVRRRGRPSKLHR